MRRALIAACLTVGALVGSTAAEAVPYDLTADFSNTDNPNAAGWSYVYPGLHHISAPDSVGNHLEPALANGFFGAGANLNNDTPFVFKSAIDGHAATGLTDSDFMTGDVVVHTPNSGSALTIQWKAPTAGTITDLAASLWYAHSTVARSNNVVLSLAGIVLDSWTISSSEHAGRGNAAAYAGAGPFAVAAGDLLTLSFTRTSPEYGSLVGVAASFEFAAAVTPIPAALPLFMTGLAGLGWIARRRGKAAVHG
ncbi:MAG TPA: hypothetical protein VHA35_12365 [Dongiaceae bacterium]|jgi:hypothetical protein|nr:hypothetical protein [Dongiaceae bacterium]